MQIWSCVPKAVRTRMYAGVAGNRVQEICSRHDVTSRVNSAYPTLICWAFTFNPDTCTCLSDTTSVCLAWSLRNTNVRGTVEIIKVQCINCRVTSTCTTTRGPQNKANHNLLNSREAYWLGVDATSRRSSCSRDTCLGNRKGDSHLNCMHELMS